MQSKLKEARKQGQLQMLLAVMYNVWGIVGCEDNSNTAGIMRAVESYRSSLMNPKTKL